jgi:GT2 family glycosyltransferase
LECTDLNLSVSRNIGIKNSSGDICAFIDDDALAHPDWLVRLEDGYISNSITGAGGYTLNHTGQSFQAKAVLCDRFGKDYPVVAGLDTDTFCFPETELYPSLLGTNSSFRREALLNIGGFDELFAYFLDETDVCLRLIENGGRLVYAPNALVQHGYASSHMRTASNIPRTRYYSVRSKVYFML